MRKSAALADSIENSQQMPTGDAETLTEITIRITRVITTLAKNGSAEYDIDKQHRNTETRRIS